MYYLKYRPKSFSELFGLEEVTKVLINSLTKKQTAHAYIFTGPKGSGKTSTARILAKALNCERLGYSSTPGVDGQDSRSLPSQAEPCNECASCQAVDAGRFLDLIEIDAASNRGIDDIRSLREKIKLSPSQGKFKVYLIDEAHMLTPEAFNALLKTLEEPPAHAVFILATTELQKLPATIRSRALVLNFKRGKKEDLLKKLRFICQREDVKISETELKKIVELSEGGYRNAETLLEQVVVGEISLSDEGFSPQRFLDLLVQGNKPGALEFLNQLGDKGESLTVFNRHLIFYLRELLLILGGVGDGVLDLGPEQFKLREQKANSLTSVKLVKLIERFLTAEERAKFSPIPELPLELAVFDTIDNFFQATDEGSSLEDEVLEPSSNLPSSVISQAKADGKVLTLAEVTRHWEEILKAVKPFNHSLEALLRSSRPKEVSADGALVVEVFYKFHKDKLSAPASVEILGRVFTSVLGHDPRLSFVLVNRPEAKITESASFSSGDDLVNAALQAFSS